MLKCTKSDTYPIVAFVEKLGAKPRKIASLYVGKRDGGRLIYAGKVRSMRTDGLTSWPKLTGGKGLHLVAPLRQPIPHDDAHRRARRLARALAARHPCLYIVLAQEDRRDRIFLDYLRNGRGTTAIGTFSPRAREGFPIAAPVNLAAHRDRYPARCLYDEETVPCPHS